MAIVQDEHWRETQKTRIKEAFALFDKDKKGLLFSYRGTIVQEEVSTVMRYLGAYPTEKAMVKDILPDMQGDDPSAAVPYFAFETKMLEMMASRAWDPDPPEVLLRVNDAYIAELAAMTLLPLNAFRTIDEAGAGYIETARMNDLLITKGTPFRAKEIEAFMSVAKDPETGHIYYEDYIASSTS